MSESLETTTTTKTLDDQSMHAVAQMESNDVFPQYPGRLSCIAEFLCGFVISVLYVGSLYVLPSYWRQRNAGRDHPSWLRERFFAAGTVCMLAVSITYCICSWRTCPSSTLQHLLDSEDVHDDNENTDAVSNTSGSFLSLQQFLRLIGVRGSGIIAAVFLPAILTLVLFVGPVVQELLEAYIVNKGEMYAFHTIKIAILQLPHYFSNYLWWRNYVVAPLSEEIVYRACILVIMEHCLSVGQLVVITPIFFGIAHVHHLTERLRIGMSLEHCLMVTAVQVCYTSVFGIYEAFIFLRTRHLTACVVVHSVCNIMGFPNLPSRQVFFNYPRWLLLVYLCYVIGLLCWLVLLIPMTSPEFYRNAFYQSYRSGSENLVACKHSNYYIDDSNNNNNIPPM